MKSGFDRWLERGLKKGYCSAPYCETHEGPPLTEPEEQAWDAGIDLCALNVRLGTPAEWSEDAQYALNAFDIRSHASENETPTKEGSK
jgi:hypothetical protein